VLRDTYPERHTADPSGAPVVRQQAQADKARLWRAYAEALGDRPWMVGGHMSALDIYAAMLAGWWTEAHTLPAIEALVARVRADPVCGRLWTEYDIRAG
jgi:GST-like protein